MVEEPVFAVFIYLQFWRLRVDHDIVILVFAFSVKTWG
jgi:hypothetical protein